MNKLIRFGFVSTNYVPLWKFTLVFASSLSGITCDLNYICTVVQ